MHSKYLGRLIPTCVDKTKAHKGVIGRAAAGKSKNAGGFIWLYGANTTNLSIERLQKHKQKKHYRAKTITYHQILIVQPLEL